MSAVISKVRMHGCAVDILQKVKIFDDTKGGLPLLSSNTFTPFPTCYINMFLAEEKSDFLLGISLTCTVLKPYFPFCQCLASYRLLWCFPNVLRQGSTPLMPPKLFRCLGLWLLLTTGAGQHQK